MINWKCCFSEYHAVLYMPQLSKHLYHRHRKFFSALPDFRQGGRGGGGGIAQGLFSCDHTEERVRMILIMSQHLFESNNFTAADIEVFIDIVEKALGAEPGTLVFIRELIK